MRRLITRLGHEVLVADTRQLRLSSESYAKNDRNDVYWLAELGRTNPELLAPVAARDAGRKPHQTGQQRARDRPVARHPLRAPRHDAVGRGGARMSGPLTSLADVLELNNDVRRVKRWWQIGAVVGCRPKGY